VLIIYVDTEYLHAVYALITGKTQVYTEETETILNNRKTQC